MQHFDFQKLLGFGISVYFTEKTLQNIIIIDEQILWYGSTTPIGFSEENDCILRINNAKIAKITAKTRGRQTKKGRHRVASLQVIVIVNVSVIIDYSE